MVFIYHFINHVYKLTSFPPGFDVFKTSKFHELLGLVELLELIGFVEFVEFIGFVELIGFIGFIELVEFVGLGG